MALQDPADGPGGDAGVLGQGVRSASQHAAGFEYSAFDGRGCAGGTAAWAAAAVPQPAPALGAVAVHPAVGALTGDAEFLRDVSDRTPVEDDTAHQQASAVKGQPGISVGHQDLRGE